MFNSSLQLNEFQDLVLEITNNKTGHLHEFKSFKVSGAIVASESEFIYKSLKNNANDR